MPHPSNEGKLVTHSNPGHVLSEAYRMLRTKIRFSGVDRRVQTLLVTSAHAGEGKTTTIANLAVTFAQEGKKTLLVDADLRRPSLHTLFKLSNRIGLTDALLSEKQWQMSVRETHVPNLEVMPAGMLPPNPSEMLSSSRMGSLLGELKQHYDMLMIDAPPLLAVTDGLLLSPHCDGVLLVIHSGKTKMSHAARVQKHLEDVGARIVGVVLNRRRRRKGEGAADGYAYSYG